jgi:hypothetical protein
MAVNDSFIEEPDEPGAFEDWFEIFKPGDTDVDMGGLYLTDDLTNPTKWQVPSGVTVPANGYLVFWADEDTDQGPTHADFKLSAHGQEIGLFAADGATEIDSVVFGAQETDISYGRYPDGDDAWFIMDPPHSGSRQQRRQPDLHRRLRGRRLGQLEREPAVMASPSPRARCGRPRPSPMTGRPARRSGCGWFRRFSGGCDELIIGCLDGDILPRQKRWRGTIPSLARPVDVPASPLRSS